MFEDLQCIVSLVLCKSCCGSYCCIVVMISRVTATVIGMCCVLAFVLFFSFIVFDRLRTPVTVEADILSSLIVFYT